MIRPPKYPRHGRLREDLNQRVEAYFAETGKSTTGGWRLLLKSLILLSWFVCSYIGAVFIAETWWGALLWMGSFALAHAGIGFCVMHDGGHGASSKNPVINKLAAYSLDLIGGSSHLWAFKHNVIHHQYPNVDGVDHDIVAQPWLRMTDTQVCRWYHRHQYIYFPLAYAFLTGKWLLHDDFKSILTGKLGTVRRPPLPRRKIAEILLWKLWAVAWVFAIPLVVHGIAWTAAFFVIWAAISGIALATVFQLAHMVDCTEITPLPAEGDRLPRTWAEQQLATTMNFAPSNKLVGWYVGGLNYQIEHHLFPKISHVHYPAIAPIVEQVCREHGVKYRSHPTTLKALRCHIHQLRELGRGPAPELVVKKPATLPR